MKVVRLDAREWPRRLNRWRFLTLRPYGSNLLTPAARVWILGMTVLVTIMAVSEGFIWGTLAQYYLAAKEDSYFRLLAYAVGLAVFLIVWLIDASFVTLDTSRSPMESHKAKLDPRTLKIGLGFVSRLAVVAGTLAFTAPALTELTLGGDIQRLYNQEVQALIRQKKEQVESEISQRYDPQINQLKQVYRELWDKLQLETAGQGVSGIYGYGPVARTIDSNLADLREQIKTLEARMADERAASLLEDPSPATFAARHGLAVPSLTPAKSRELMQKVLATNESAQRVELLARVYIALLFLGLVIFKAFAPRGVVIYYNEELQDLYLSYKRGLLNRFIGDKSAIYVDERHQMTPYRFAEWWTNAWAARLKQDLHRFQMDAELQGLATKLKLYGEQIEDAQADMEPLRSRRLELVQQKMAWEKQLKEAVAALGATRRKLAAIPAPNGFAGKGLDRLLQKELNDERSLVEHQIDMQEADVERLRHELSFLGTEVAEIEKEIVRLKNSINELLDLREKTRMAYIRRIDVLKAA